MKHYDVIVIGAGPGGKATAMHLAKNGLHVALIEKDNVGGTCLNEGCIPAKLYLESAIYLSKLKHFENFGLHVENPSFNIRELKIKKNELLSTIRIGAQGMITREKIDFIQGVASFIDQHSIKVNNDTFHADKFVIATGSIHKPHPILKLDTKQIISSKEVFQLESIPSSILIVGGGAIGCEFATFFNSLGSKVTIAEFTPNIVPAEDEDIAKGLKRELEKKGISILLSTNITTCSKNADGVSITMNTPKGEITQKYGLVLVSIGRAPNTKDLKLQNIGIECERGFVVVDAHLRTANPSIYALGDVIATPALAHTAYDEAKVVAQNIIKNATCKPSKVIPFVTFCQPQVASAGLNERTLREQGKEYEVIKHFFKSSAKAKIKGDDSGFIKLIIQKNTGVILGGAMIGNDTTELIHELVIAINTKLTKEDLAKMVFAHPTLSESLWEMVQ